MGWIDIAIKTRLKSFMLSVALSVDDELLVLVGPSGAGKSVVLRSIAGVYTPDDGVVEIHGEPVFNASFGIALSPADRHVGYVPQNFALFGHLPVSENVAFPLRRGRQERFPEVESRVADVLELLHLSHIRDAQPGSISATERVWVAVARALVTDPDVLLLDDIFAPLEHGPRRQVRVELAMLRRSIGVPTILATGELEEACEIGDRLAVVEFGRILQVGSSQEVLKHPVDRQVARMVGAINIVPGTVVDSADGWVTVQTAIGDLRFPGENPWGHELDIVLRPDMIQVVGMGGAGGRRAPSGGTVFPATIVDELRHGAEHALYVRPDNSSADDPLEVRVADLMYQQNGLAGQRRCWLVLPDEAIHPMPRHSSHAV